MCLDVACLGTSTDVWFQYVKHKIQIQVIPKARGTQTKRKITRTTDAFGDYWSVKSLYEYVNVLHWLKSNQRYLLMLVL